MKYGEWEKLVEEKGGQVFDIPPDQIEIVQAFFREWRNAQLAFQEATRLIGVTRTKMHEYVELILPQLEGWEYIVNFDKNQVTLTFPEVKD